MTGQDLRPTPLESATHIVAGAGPDAGPLPAVDGRLGPRLALEQAMLPALARPPCLVSFSGGVDSSAVLAVATSAARREGLPAPVPVTVRFSNAPYADESTAQERVVHHLGLSDWQRHQASEGEFDWVGPRATAILRRHGLIYPANAFFHAPLLEAARGGALMTGVGGDQMMDHWRWRIVADVVARRVRPGPRDLGRLVHAAAPRAVKRARARCGLPRLSWLTPAAQDALTTALAREQAGEPVAWDRRVRWRLARRGLALTRWSLSLLARDADAVIEHPLLDPRFLASLARAGGRTGFGGRTEIMRELCGDLLPEDVLARSDKAVFHEVFWGPHFRDFATRWRGAGIDRRLVDEGALRAEWDGEVPIAASALLLQSAWLASTPGDEGHQPVGGAS